jgi:protein TonB
MTDYARRGWNPGRHMPTVLVVLALHLMVGYALVTGLARRVVEVVKSPLETKIIAEVRKPPPEAPPPPPPKLAVPPPTFIPPPEINIQVPVQAPPPTITTVTTTSPAPGPPPVAQTVATAQPVVRREFKPSYRLDPEFPRLALSRGIEGRVTAWIHVTPAGTVGSVEIRRTSDRMFDREVIRALSQWRFAPEPVGFVAEYDIVFQLKD